MEVVRSVAPARIFSMPARLPDKIKPKARATVKIMARRKNFTIDSLNGKIEGQAPKYSHSGVLFGYVPELLAIAYVTTRSVSRTRLRLRNTNPNMATKLSNGRTGSIDLDFASGVVRAQPVPVARLRFGSVCACSGFSGVSSADTQMGVDHALSPLSCVTRI